MHNLIDLRLWTNNLKQWIMYWIHSKFKPMHLPVCTLSPVSSSDIGITFPFSRAILAVDGKQPPPDGGGGGGGCVGTRK